MNELIQQARELCEKHLINHENGVDAFESYVPLLCDALEAAQKENERLKAENKRLDIEDAKDALRGDTLRGELYDMTARAEKAEAERDAAVEDLKQHILWNGTACTYCRYCEEAESALSPCDTCEDIPDTKMPTNWEWRGQQAGEGGQDE